MRWVVLVFGLSLPAAMALIDCIGRAPERFEGGAPDRASWLRWLAVAVATSWLLVGNGVVLAYYWSVIKRSPPVGLPPA